MARNGRNNVSFRRVAAGAFVFVGLFGMCFGFGSGSQTMVVTGAAVVVLAFSLRLFTSLRRNPRQWVAGTGHVLEVSDPPEAVRYGRCTLRLAIEAPGLASESVVVNEARAPVAQWPVPGMDLPVEVAADDPRVVRILWKSSSDTRGFSVADLPLDDLPLDDLPRDDAFLDDFPLDDLPLDDLPLDDAARADLPPDDLPFAPFEAPDAAPAGEPASVAEPAVVDFDLDEPPAAAPRAAGPRSRPVVAPLPPELAPLPPVSADPGAPAEPGPAPQPSRPVPPQPAPRRPSPRPRREPAPVLAGATTAAASGTAASGTAAGAAGRRTGARGGTAVVDEPVTSFPSAHPGPAGAINHVGITVLVSDLAQSIAFYRDQLGFYEDHEADAGAGSSVLASGETRLVLRATPQLDRITHRSVFLNLEVGDIDGVYADLRAGGVKFIKAPHQVSHGARRELWAAVFQDPDGHGIALTQWRPAGANGGRSGNGGRNGNGGAGGSAGD